MLIFLLLLSVQAQRDRPSDSPKPPTSDPVKTCFSPTQIMKCGFFDKLPSELCGRDTRPTCNEVVAQTLLGLPLTLVCPSCIPVEYLGSLCMEKPLVACESNAVPSLVFNKEKRSLCGSCFKIPTTVERCSLDSKQACYEKLKAKTVPACVGRELPTLTKDCCFSCRRELPKEDDKICPTDVPDCEKVDIKDMDKVSLEDIKELGDRGDDGCRLCAPLGPLRALTEKCSIADFRKYKEEAPDCDSEERPPLDKLSTRCGPPCIRQASKKHLLEIVACRRDLEDCGDDDRSKRSIFLPGTACPICKVQRPTCNCDRKHLCVRDNDGERKCVRKKIVVIRLKLKANVKAELRDVSKEVMTGILKELLQRFCERNGEAVRCNKNLNRILDSIKCTGKTNIAEKDDTIEIEIEVAEGADEVNRRRLLQLGGDDIVKLVEDALKDDNTYVDSTESTPSLDIPAEKMCFLPENIVKCKLLGVLTGEYCKQKAHCNQSREVQDPAGQFLISCPSCIPPDYTEHLCKQTLISTCTETNEPTVVWKADEKSLCPSCWEKKIPENKCTWEKKKECLEKMSKPDFAKCYDREIAIKDDCCFSCRLAKEPEEVKCKQTLITLPECEDIDTKKVDIREAAKKLGERDDNGCRTCSPQGPIRIKKCSPLDFRSYKKLVPTCDAGEKGIVRNDSTRCGPACIRQASRKHFLQVIACSRELPECEDDDRTNRHIFLPDEACPICEAKRPTCSCEDDQVCVRDKEGEAKCVGKKRFVMKLKLKAIVKKEFRQIKKKVMTRVLKEMLERFCERTGESERCEKHLDRILDSINCTGKKNITTADQDEVELDVEIAEAKPETGRRLLASGDDTINLLLDAAKDDETYVSSALDDGTAPTTGPNDGTPGIDDTSSSSAIFVSISFLLSMIGISLINIAFS